MKLDIAEVEGFGTAMLPGFGQYGFQKAIVEFLF